MDMEKLKVELVEDEGLRKKPYRDSKGIWTGGIGHNLEAHKAGRLAISSWLKTGIPDAVIDGWFEQDIAEAVQVVQAIFGDLEALPDPAARTLANMAFDLMWELRDWHHLILAVKDRDWKAAATSILNSKWAHERKGGANRCCRLAARIMQAEKA